MRFAAVLNRDGGTLRTTDIDAFAQRMQAKLEASGHSIEIEALHAGDVEEALHRVAARRDVDVILVGGGDGTVSAAAKVLSEHKDKALAILPAGTMNLFARGLGIPQTLDRAIDAFAAGEIHAVDLASANGRIFVHQFSIGMHAKMVHLRDRMEFSSRLGKMMASLKAAFRTVMRPPSMIVQLTIGQTEIVKRTSGVGITNNLFGEGHLPYADDPDGGVLGIYVSVARHRREILHYAYNLMRGRWRDNAQVELHEGKSVVLRIKSRRKRIKAVIDGELTILAPETIIKIHPKALNVLVPSAVAWAKAA